MLKLELHSLSSPVAIIHNPNHARVFSTNSFGFAPNTTSFQSEYLELQQRLTATPPTAAAGSQIPAGGAFKMSREGFVLLQFAPAAGVRVYDWSRKQVFSLSVTEIGHIVSLGAKESCEFFHDPFKGKSEEGKVRKVLKVEPLPDGSGRFFNLNVQNKLINLEENIYIPVTRAEFAVLNSAFNYLLPYLIGWHAYVNSVKPEEMSRVNNATPRYGGDFEWSR